MNERIRQLADKAGGFPLNPDCHDGEDNGYGFRERSLERLIELIVQECSTVIVNGGYRNPALDEKHPLTPPEIATMIKEHFGVEE